MDKTKVLASGKFDLLHPGHLYYLRKSSELAENSELWVVIAHEENVQECIFNNQERKEILEAIEFVDEVIIGSKDVDFEGVLRRAKPDVVALGYDQDEEGVGGLLERFDIRVEKVDAFKPGKYSSSKIKKEIRGS